MCLYHQAEGETVPATTVDHVVPLAHGGHPTDPRNLAASCVECNARKLGRTPTEAGLRWPASRGLTDTGRRLGPESLTAAARRLFVTRRPLGRDPNTPLAVDL